MHYHCEIVLPKVDDAQIRSAIGSILKDFDENGTDEDGNPSPYAFWDWWVIGGRWAGAKQEALLGAENIQKFRDELVKRNVTVSGLQCGKQELRPASQIAEVDELWREWFPESKLKTCPLFAHSNDQYREYLPGDVMPLSMVPRDMECARVIIATPRRDWCQDGSPEIVGEFEAATMLETECWNGVTSMRTDWDGKFGTALDRHTKSLEHATPEYREKITPNENWVSVTVDYHS